MCSFPIQPEFQKIFVSFVNNLDARLREEMQDGPKPPHGYLET